MNPLEMALKKPKKTCANCADRQTVNGVDYCGKSGKILHPLLMREPYTGCPIEKRGTANEKNE